MSFDVNPSPKSPPSDPRRARLWAVLPRLILSAFAGGMLALSLTAATRGFWDGVLVGIGAQMLIRVVVAVLLRGRQDTLVGGIMSVMAGAAVGTGVAALAADEHILSLAIVGGLVGGVDAVVTWVMFPTGNRTPTEPDDPPGDSDDEPDFDDDEFP